MCAAAVGVVVISSPTRRAFAGVWVYAALGARAAAAATPPMNAAFHTQSPGRPLQSPAGVEPKALAV